MIFKPKRSFLKTWTAAAALSEHPQNALQAPANEDIDNREKHSRQRREDKDHNGGQQHLRRVGQTTLLTSARTCWMN